MTDPGSAPRPVAQDCPCVQKACPIWGDCEACIDCRQELVPGIVSWVTRRAALTR